MDGRARRWREVLGAPWSPRTWRSLAHLVLGGLLWLAPAAAVLLLTASAAKSGWPAVPLLLVLLALLAGVPLATRWQRIRFRTVLGVVLRDHPAGPAGGSRSRRLIDRLAGRRTWRQAGYHLLGGVLDATAATLAVLGGLLAVVLLAVSIGSPTLAGSRLALDLVLGPVLLYAALWLARGAAGLDVALARRLLQIRQRWPWVAVMVLSQYVEERYATDLLAGRTSRIGYLLKDRVADVEEFVAAARRVAEGGTALDPEVVSQLLIRRRADPLERLTAREREVLALMAEGRSNAGIGSALMISDSAVAKHVNSIFTKLDLVPADTDHRRVLAVLRFFGAG